jgi:predicted nucleic acid-binding protein
MPAPPYPRISNDPDDDHLLALARESDPNYLCTNDVEGLLELHFYRDTLILEPPVLFGILIHGPDLIHATSAGRVGTGPALLN